MELGMFMCVGVLMCWWVIYSIESSMGGVICCLDGRNLWACEKVDDVSEDGLVSVFISSLSKYVQV